MAPNAQSLTQMNPQTRDNCPYCRAKPYSEEDGYSCGTEVIAEWGISRSGICYQNQIFQLNNEVARLREFIKSIMPTPPYGEQEPEWRYAEKLLAETAPAPEEPDQFRDAAKMVPDHIVEQHEMVRPAPEQPATEESSAARPLEEEFNRLKDRNWYADPIPDITTCLRYLRDEVEQVKATVNKMTPNF